MSFEFIRLCLQQQGPSRVPRKQTKGMNRRKKGQSSSWGDFGHHTRAVHGLPGPVGVCRVHAIYSPSRDANQGLSLALMTVQTSLKDFLFPSRYLDMCVM